jgi:hypothetical protein
MAGARAFGLVMVLLRVCAGPQTIQDQYQYHGHLHAQTRPSTIPKTIERMKVKAALV